jgi:hypothetical protein
MTGQDPFTAHRSLLFTVAYATLRSAGSPARSATPGPRRSRSTLAHFSRIHAASPAVIVRPNLFQQNVTESTIPSIDGNGQFYLDAGPARISMVDTRDVAAVAAVALTGPGHAGVTYDVTGPEALSYHDVAAKLTPVLAREIRYIETPRLPGAIRKWARTRRLRDRLRRPSQPPTTAPPVNPMASRLRSAGPPGPSTAAGAAAAFLPPARGYRQ